MAEKVYGLSESDLAILRELVSTHRGKYGNRPPRPEELLDSGSPEVYVAQIPTGGLPARVGNTIRSVDCQIYRTRVNNVGTGGNSLQAITGLVKRIYNLSPEGIEAGTYVLVWRDKYGEWYTTGDELEESEVGTGTGTGETEYVEITLVTGVCLVASGVGTSTSTAVVGTGGVGTGGGPTPP